MSAQRLTLFIDAQNVYQGARQAFPSPSDSHVFGQFDPIKLGQVICDRSPPGTTRVLHQVRLYTGRPDSTKEPRTYAAHMRQCAAWEKTGAKVIWRALRYSADWPATQAEQKGIDVALAIDFVALAIDGKYDVGVIFSTDSDLIPALEFVYSRGSCRVEVAAWSSPRSRKSLRISQSSIWCYKLTKDDYDSIADLTDYNL